MIRIEEFLFVENIDQTQAESLIDRFPNLNFRTKDEFYKYFETQSIRLQKGKTKPAITSTGNAPNGDPGNDTQLLLERLKNFKSSSDYDYVKKYIIKQKVIQDSISSNNLDLGRSTLNEINQEKLDPFFNFVVRKILTGSETGLLPSENLKSIFDDLTKKTKRENEINTEDIVPRDSDNRIISYKNYLKNRGSIHVPLVDYRFTVPSVDYVIPKSFSSIPEAVNAEKNVLKKAEEWSSDVTIVADQAVLIEKLKELINEDDRTVPGLELKVENLTIQLEAAKEREQSLVTTTDNLVEAIDQLSNEYLLKAAESQAKDQEIIQLNQAIDNTLSNLQTSVSSQLEDSKASFDNLSAKLEEEANKRSEEIKASQQQAAEAAKAAAEQSAAQLAAFEKAIGGITSGLTDALKPKEPEPSPENPATEIIKQILDRWDKMTVIPESSYNKFVQILDLLGAKKPVKSTYVFLPPAKGNPYTPSEEIKQHLKWNTELKPQIKALVVSLTDKKKAETILKNVTDISNDNAGSFNNNALIATVTDALEAWVEDAAKVRGVATPFIRRIALELGAKFADSNDLGNNKEAARLGVTNIREKLTRDTEQLINILTILDEIKNKLNTGFGW